MRAMRGIHPAGQLVLLKVGSEPEYGLAARLIAPTLCGQPAKYAAATHPDWIALDGQGKQAKRGGPPEAGWYTLDMSSPYQEYVAEQLAEVLRRFAPVDGLFLDMCWDQPSLSRYAIDGM